VSSVVARIGGFPWHPFLSATVIVVTLWLDAAVSPYAVFRSLLAVNLMAGALLAIGAVAFRSLQLGAIAATSVIWLLWSKHVTDLIATAFERIGAFAFVWIAAITVAIVLVVRLLARAARSWRKSSVTSVLNRASALLLVAAVVVGVIDGSFQWGIRDLSQGISLSQWTESGGSGPTAEQPDVFVILLDGYPRADVLEYAFGIDNSSFVDALEQRGFEVKPLAHSDYLWTHVSVPSALNLAYVEQIPELEPVVDGSAPQQPTIRHAIADNAAFAVMRDRGYDAVAVSSGFEQVAARQADVWVDNGELTEFEVSLLSSTFAGAIANVVAPDFASSQQRHRILGNLAALPEIAGTRDRPPAFVFAHIPAPHQPTVFGEGGAPVAVPITDGFYGDSPIERKEDPEEFKDRYRAQLPYLNERILEAIDGVIAEAVVPPVIVLFADHGSASRTDWNATDPATVDPTILLERTGTLLAALTPGHAGVYPDDVSPTDMLRLLFDTYFGTDYGRAEPPPDGGQIEPVDAGVLDR